MSVVSVEVRQIGDTTTLEGVARDHRVIIDRPLGKGGADRGPLGGEMLLLSLGGCYLSTLIAAARARNFDVSDLRAVVRGELGGTPERLQAAKIEVHGESPDEETLQKAIEIAERSCIVTNTLKGSMPVNVKRVPPRH